MFIFRVASTKDQHPVLDFVVIGFTLCYGPSLCQIHTLASRFIPTGLYILFVRINELYYNNFLLCRLQNFRLYCCGLSHHGSQKYIFLTFTYIFLSIIFFIFFSLHLRQVKIHSALQQLLMVDLQQARCGVTNIRKSLAYLAIKFLLKYYKIRYQFMKQFNLFHKMAKYLSYLITIKIQFKLENADNPNKKRKKGHFFIQNRKKEIIKHVNRTQSH